MKISVVTVCYNSANTIEDTIKSVYNQEFHDYEYIVVDGGSSDNTLEILKRYEGLFEGKMKWISERDNGIYDAMNKGIRMASGSVVGVLNSDDFFHRTDILGIISDTFEKNPGVEALYGDVKFVSPNDTHKTIRYYSSKRWKPWKFRFAVMPAHPSFYTYKRNFDKYGYYKCDYQISADFDLLLRHLYIHKVPAIYIPVDFVTMRMGGKSTAGFKSNILANREDARSCAENGVKTWIPLMYLKYFFKIFEFLVTKND